MYSYLVSSDCNANWLTLPRVIVPENGDISLYWDIRSSIYGSNIAQYEIVVSTESQMDYDGPVDTLFSETVLPALPYVHRSLSLNDYAGDSIWLSFRQTPSIIDTDNYSSSNIYIDNVAFLDNTTAAGAANRPVAILNVDSETSIGYNVSADVTVIGGSTSGLTYSWGSRMNDNGEAAITTSGNYATISYSSSGTDSVWVVVSNDYGSDTLYSFVYIYNYEPATLPFVTGFESGDDEAYGYNWWGWGWNDNVQWYFGNAASSSGSRSMYISNDGGNSNSYDTTTAHSLCLYRVIDFTQSGRYIVNYDWRAMGEVSNNGYAFDFLRVYLTPLSVGGFRSGIYNNSLPDSFIPLDGGGALAMQSSFINHNEIIEIETPGLYALCFYWRNDASNGTQPSAAIDNIEVFSADCKVPQNISFSIDSNNILLSWDDASPATGWLVSVDQDEYATNSSFITLTNIDFNVSHNIAVRCICGSDTSDAALITIPACYNRYYVTQLGAGLMDGTSWSNAMNSIQLALDAAISTRSLCRNNPEVWVAAGTYYGDTMGDNAFTMVEGINIYGGFAGNETLLSDRPRGTNGLFTNPTILDGRDERRVLNQPSHFDNLTIWDGFVIQHGNGNSYGGGVYLQGNGRLEHCIVTDNHVNYYGGGVYCTAYSSYDYNTGNYRYKYPQLIGCIFSDNTADNYGGGIYSNGDSIVNCLIVGNNAYYGGGIYTNNNNSSIIDHATIVSNFAYYGGGIYNRSNKSTLQNSILWGNTANNSNSNQCYNSYNFNTLNHCAIEGNIPYYNDGEGNLVLAHSNAGSSSDSNNAFFVNPEGGNFYLAPQSACVDAGTVGNGFNATDLAGNARTYGNTADIGCYEWNGEAVCLAPYGLTVSNIAQTSAMVSWNCIEPNATSIISYRGESDSLWTEVGITMAHSYLISGLNPATRYQISIRGVCDSMLSSAGVVIFTTTSTCFDGNEIEIGGESMTEYAASHDWSGGRYSLPFSHYPYTYTQEIFLTQELPEQPYNISSIALQYISDVSNYRDIDIYLGHTSRNDLSNPEGFIPADSLVLVFSGRISTVDRDENNWITVTLNNMFVYNGTDNIVLAIDDNTNGLEEYDDAVFYLHHTSSPMTCCYFYHEPIGDNGQYYVNVSPENPCIQFWTTSQSYRNNIKFIGECDTTIKCIQPNLIVNYVTDSSANVMWAIEPGANCELQYKSEHESQYVTVGTLGNSHTFSNLEFNTAYSIRLRQVCGNGDTSIWKNASIRTSVPQFDIIYVKENATGNGSSWSNATGDLNWALSTANAVKLTYGTAPVIWVAQGTYYGDTTAENAFTMVDGINVYGGFSGNGMEHDINIYPTILDGQNAHRVLYQPNHFDSFTLWSGFTIQNGVNSNGYGGGAYLQGNGMLSNCVIIDNNAYYGAGVFCFGTSTYNHDTYEYQYLYANLLNCRITNNTASENGGGVCGGEYTIMYNCLVDNNTSNYNGGGIYYGSYNYLYNCDIVNNGSLRYGAVGSDAYYKEESNRLVDCIIWGNHSNSNYAAIAGNLTFENCAIEGGYSGTGNVPLSTANNDGGMMNPRFVHPSSGIGAGHYDGDWHLMDGSACVNRGREITTHSTHNYDLDGNTRVQQGTVDIGCYETSYQEAPIQHHADGIMYVRVDGTGNGTSWDNAMGSLADALQMVPFTDAQQVWVAEGTYTGGITMTKGVNVYGGFEGNEPATYDLTFREWQAHATILSGGSTVLYQANDFVDSTATLWDGFIIRNGSSQGVYLRAHSSLMNCVVENNGTSNTSNGGGIYASGSIVKNVVVRNNYGYSGGGVYTYNSTFSNCNIHDNGSSGYGGGVYDNGNSIFRNCNIVNNNSYDGSSDVGRGVYLSNSSSYSNCIIWGNGASSENIYVYNDRYYNYGYYGYSLDTTSFTFCAIESGRTGEGNITLPSGNDDASGVAFEDPNDNDYHLTAASVCIGTGSNAAVVDSLDLEGNIRIYDSVVDMGVYELRYSLTCPSPRNPRVVNADSTGAVIVWSGETGATYRVKYYSVINPVPVLIIVNDTTITLPSLAQGNYYWCVQRYCSATDTSLWAKGPSFCTVHPEEPVVEGGSYQIYTPGQLMWIAGVVNGNITSGTDGVYPTNNTNMTGLKVQLMNNIDITGIVWDPIGNNQIYYRSGYGTYYCRFNGELDGGGYAVINPCLLDRYANYVGLFGFLENGSNVHDLGIEGNLTIYGNKYVGGIAGYSYASMTNVYNKLNVEGIQYVGGLAGYSNTSSDYYYDDYGDRVYYSNGATYNSVYNTGDIQGATYVGGVSGSYGRVTNAYNRGDISAVNYYSGGIVGYSGTVNSTYNTGNVTGSYRCNAINYGGSRYNSFYLEGSCADGGGTPLSDYQMQHPTFVSTLNLGQTPAPWRSDYDPAINDGYPILNFEEHQFTVNYAYSGSGSLNVMNGGLSISRGDRVVDNTLLTVTATPSSGYRMTSLAAVTVGNDTIELDAMGIDTLRIHSDVNIIATFQPCNGVLAIDNFSASHFIPGQVAQIAWQIRNTGEESTCGNWNDIVVLSTDSASFYMYSSGGYYFNRGYNTRIYPRDYYYYDDDESYQPHPSYLDPDQSYTASCSYNVPYNLQYNYRYIFLISGNQYCCIRIERDDSPSADLKMETVVAPANMFAGSQVSVMASVSNIGQNRTSSNVWTDAVYMSFSPTWNRDSATLVGTLQHNGHLHVDSSYSMIFTANVPERFYGTCYFYVMADYNEEVRDIDIVNNVRRSTAVNVFMANPSDLVVQSFTADNEVAVGNCLNYNYQFSNNGPTTIGGKNWQDRVYLVPMQDTTRIIASSIRWNESWYEYYEANYGWHYSDTLPIGIIRERNGEICIDRWSFEDNALDTGYYYLYLMLDYQDIIFEHEGEANNLVRLSHPVHVVWKAPLVVRNLMLPDTARAGQQVQVEFDIVNQSQETWNGFLSPRSYLYNSNYDEYNSYNSWYEDNTTQIAAGDSVHRSYTMTIPPYLSDDTVRFAFSATNNSSSINSDAAKTIYFKPYGFDLSLAQFRAPTVVVMGDSITLSWTVQNVSDLPNDSIPMYQCGSCASWSWEYDYTDENDVRHYLNCYYNSCTSSYNQGSQWYDRIYLSTDSIFSFDDQQLGEYYFTDTLYPGESYNRSVTVAMPYALQGDVWLLMIADGALTAYDANRENNIIARPITINRTPLPDLRIESLTMDTVVKAGNSYTLTYTVSNVGEAATPIVGWIDAFFIINDSRSNATQLRTKIHNTTLGVNESYTDTVIVTIPSSYNPGYYFVIGQTDADYYYYDTDMESNNLLAFPVQVAQPDAVDLAVFEPQLPALALAGSEITVSWRLRNQGSNDIRSNIQELIYLSTDNTIGTNAIYVGSMNSQVSIAPGEMENHTYTFKVDGVIDGQYHLIVRTDASHRLRDINRNNNTAASVGTMIVSIPTLSLGQEEYTTIDSGGCLYYKLIIPSDQAHQDIIVQSKADRRNATTGLFVSREALPKPSTAQFADQSVYVTDRTILLTDASAGTYYIILHGSSDLTGTSAVSLWASVLHFEIVSVDANQAGNTGSVTTEIRGSQFDTVMDLRLVKEGVNIPAEKVTFVNSTKVYATFNLTDQAEGVYSLEAELPGGATITKENCFTVRQSVPAELQLRIYGESAIVVGNTAVVNIEYANMGETDIPIPALLVDGGEHFIALDADSLINEQKQLIVPIADERGGVRPGESGIITIYVKAASTANLHLKVYGMKTEE